MKKLIQTLLVTLFFAQIFVFQACEQNLDAASSKVTLTTIEDTIAYGIGVYSASFFKQSNIENPNLTAVYKGLKDALDSTALFTDEQFSQIAQEFFQAQADKKSSEVKEKGKKFLEENASKDGVLTTASGLQYKIIQEGAGQSPASTDEVTVHYEGRLIDGTVFDSSIARGEPVSFPVDGVIAGWTEALQMMKPGAKWQLYIPSDLAYGDRGAGQDIGPGETLIFDVELISVNKK
ncbi:MAG: FKBP-type peptidyl-prolyl cis-trans isomerase [Saprospiraceae bacterium]|nr:FKBP-type peptidyl-prolyl cis-trans isomerase [Saprospiraceae bacterium]